MVNKITYKSNHDHILLVINPGELEQKDSNNDKKC
jgi:hypothetical protein